MNLRSFALAAAVAFMATPSHASLVTNGGFEAGLTGWSCVVFGGACGTDNFAAPPEGAAHFFGFQNVDPEGFLRQTLGTVAGASYSISFLFNSNANEPSNRLAVDVGDLNVVLDVVPDTWIPFIGSFTASGTSTDLEFLFRTVGGSGTLMIDNVAVEPTAAVPSPGSLALLLAGLGLAGAARRSRT